MKKVLRREDREFALDSLKRKIIVTDDRRMHYYWAIIENEAVKLKTNSTND